jgi:hypothetical protein
MISLQPLYFQQHQKSVNVRPYKHNYSRSLDTNCRVNNSWYTTSNHGHRFPATKGTLNEALKTVGREIAT